MRSGFEKVKTRYKRRAVIYGVAGGVLLGLAVTGILLIALKLSYIELGWYIYLIIGVGVAAVSAAALCFLLKPDDKKLAKKLDSMYALDEQTQTRVEFDGEEGSVIELQRDTADKTLENLPKKRPSVVNVVLQAVAVAVALALFISGIIVPQKRAAEKIDPVYTIDETKLTLLENLMDDVQGDSVMDSGVQAAYLTELGALYDNLNSDNLSSTKVTNYVQDSMYSISDIAIAANTYDDICRMISAGDDSVEYFAAAIRSAAKASGSDGADIDLTSYDNLGTAAQNKMSTVIANSMSDAGDTLTAAITALEDSTVLSTLYPYVSALQSALTDSSLSAYYDALITDGGLTFGSARTGKATSGDGLYDELYDLYYTLNLAYTGYYNYVNNVGNFKFTSAANVKTYIYYDATQTESNNIYLFVRDGGTALQTQAYTYLSDAYIRYTLGAIFGVTVVGTKVDDGEEDSTSGGDGESGGGGSGGTGETLYPGDDKIYNPDTLDYSYYYEMLNDANAGYLVNLYTLLESDDISEEIKNYIRAYISELL